MSTFMGTTTHTDRVAGGIMSSEPTTCVCCGLPEAVSVTHEICPVCHWHHGWGSTEPWDGSAFDGPNFEDVGHRRIRLWQRCLTDPSMAELEERLLPLIQQQGPRPATVVPAVDHRQLDRAFQLRLEWEQQFPRPQLVVEIVHYQSEATQIEIEDGIFDLLGPVWPRHQSWDESQRLMLEDWTTTTQHNAVRVAWRLAALTALVKSGWEVVDLAWVRGQVDAAQAAVNQLWDETDDPSVMSHMERAFRYIEEARLLDRRPGD